MRDRGGGDRQPLRRAPGARSRGQRAHAARRARARRSATTACGSPGSPTSPRRVHATADPAELPDFDLGIVATKATQLEEAAARARRPLPRRDADDDPERPRRRGARARARRLAAALGGDVHDAASATRTRTSSTSSTPRPGSGRSPGTATYEQAQEIEALLVAVGPARPRLPRPAAGAVVEADLQRDREHGRRAHRPAARRRVRRAASTTTDLGHLVHDLMDEGKAVAAAAGVELHEDPWEMNVHAVRRGETLAAEGHYAHVPSMLEDVRAGRADRDRLHHRRARPRGRAARRPRAAAHGDVPAREGAANSA